ncbi:hypothetical protein A0H81_02075 [Grifola frondosa]|uniref:Uncharacterized protein n=1 Tax=Grifola frondosa TaxID=5627 RepID=A0A1C7MMR9_GRIFR|nr:hypothetical protein A0H81_02075 [Grifola frondosa]
MPKTRRMLRGVLDPSSVDVPSVRPQPPKRSASTASLPTPPRTATKRKRRARSRATDSDEEDEDTRDVPGGSSGEERGGDERHGVKKVGALVLGHKKRKTLDIIAAELSEATVEEAFWLGASVAMQHGSDTRGRSRSRSRTRSPSPPPAPHLLRRGHSGLISPPPSRRRPVIVPRPATPPPRASTPPKDDTVFPKRDSPDNPFLADDSPALASDDDDDGSQERRGPVEHVEKPYIACVFRGQKTYTINPFYRSAATAAALDEAEARARLPIDHPDFSPSEACPPKLLFPEARKKARRQPAPSQKSKPQKRAQKTVSPSAGPASWDWSDDEGERKVKPQLQAKPQMQTRASAAAESLDMEALQAAMATRLARRLGTGVVKGTDAKVQMRNGGVGDGEEAPRTRPGSRLDMPRLPEKDRSDPLRRAVGPPRVAEAEQEASR